MAKMESLSVLIVTPFVPDGVNVAVPLAVKSPLTVNEWLIVVKPVLAPRVTVVAAAPIFNVVALLLNNVAVVFVVVKSPPFNAKSPEEVMLPVRVEVPSTVSVPFAWMLPVFEIDTPVEP